MSSQNLSFTGYAESDATFGLPPLGPFSSVSDLLDGVTKVEVWQASAQRWRVDALSDVSERDQYQVGPTLEYTWDSQQQLLTEITGRPSIRLPVAADLVPTALAQRLLRQAGSRATFSLLPPRRVAGQDASGLRIVPSDPASTIGHADIWANPHNGLPLLVDITARNAPNAALTTQFFQVTPWHPDAAVLTPRTAAGTGFTVTPASSLSNELNNLLYRALPATLDGRAQTTVPVPGSGVYGTGLAAFAVLAIRGQHALIDDAISAGATPFTLPAGGGGAGSQPGGQGGDGGEAGDSGAGAYASAPLINLVLVHEAHSPNVFLLAGLVSRGVLLKAAQQLVADS